MKTDQILIAVVTGQISLVKFHVNAKIGFRREGPYEKLSHCFRSDGLGD